MSPSSFLSAVCRVLVQIHCLIATSFAFYLLPLQVQFRKASVCISPSVVNKSHLLTLCQRRPCGGTTVGNHFADKDLSRHRNHDHALAVAIAMREEKADGQIFQSHVLREQLFLCVCHNLTR